MIEVWSWPTPNGHKVHIALEELGLDYKVIPVNIGAGDQFKPEFLAITPNHRIPAIVDHEGPGGKKFTLFESAAIRSELASRAGFSNYRPAAVRWREHLQSVYGGMADLLEEHLSLEGFWDYVAN